MPSITQQHASLHTLNYAAAALHGVQALVVLLLILTYMNQRLQGAPLLNGIYEVQKNVFVLRYPEGSPKCSLPPLRGTNNGSLTAVLGGLSIETTNYHRFQDTYAIPHNFSVGYADLRYLIFAFFLLSFVFQLFDGLAGTYSTSPEGPRLLRFVEYSFSASTMILAIALEMGIVDVYTLTCMFTLIFATNILGLIAEALMYMVESSPDLANPDSCLGLNISPIYFWTVPHFLSWIVCLVGYAPLIDAYLTSTSCSERSPPGFVNVIVFLEFGLFVCFGFVQVYSLYARTALLVQAYSPNLQEAGGWRAQITLNADYAYILLSFIAKTLLAWLILAPTLS